MRSPDCLTNRQRDILDYIEDFCSSFRRALVQVNESVVEFFNKSRMAPKWVSKNVSKHGELTIATIIKQVIETIINVIVDLEKRIVTIIAQIYFQYISRLLNRRFRNGRRSRRLLLHHAYLVCSSSLEIFRMKYYLANGTFTRG